MTRKSDDGFIDQKTLRTVITGVVLVVLLISFVVRTMKERRQEQHPPPPTDSEIGPADPSVYLTMGNPSRATDDPANVNNYLMRKPYFALAYNNAAGTPNWVSWSLTDADLGAAPRVDFYPDTTLAGGFKRVTPRDYSGSGFDRGHMCPHSDRAATPEASKATFVMSNMVPQAPHLNQQAWADFEDYCRTLVKRKPRALYIVTGPSGQGGEGTNGRAETIAGGKVTVPAKCWKVVLAVENGTGSADDITKVSSSSRTIAVVMPNDQTVGHGWAKYRTSVTEVEALSGYKFFDRVPPSVIDPLKAKVDDESIPAIRHP